VVDKSSSWGWRGGVGYVTPQMVKDHLPPPSPDTLILVRPFRHVLCCSLSLSAVPSHSHTETWHPEMSPRRASAFECLLLTTCR